MRMSDQGQLRYRASRLLAMAFNARQQGHGDYAERFAQRASEILYQPTALERLGTQSGKKVRECAEPCRDHRHRNRRANMFASRARSQNRMEG